MARRSKAAVHEAQPPTLSELIGRLGRKRQELIRPVLENPRDFVLLSARGLARKLKVDPATTVRIVLSMGFGSYREFREYLHELAIAQATSLDMMRTARVQTSNLSAYVRKAVEQDGRNLQRLRNSLEAERIAAVARRIYAARRVLVLGGDLAAILAKFLQYQLIMLGLPVMTSLSSGEMAHMTRLAGKDDLVIAVSFRRGLRQTVEGLQQAKANGAYCVGITDTFVSPIARFADETFIASVESPSFGVSYAAPICLLNAIIAACGYYRGARTRRLLKKIAEEQRRGFRWYPG
jgi:DNA-binding MurR/RpiR family transcriptional regulator